MKSMDIHIDEELSRAIDICIQDSAMYNIDNMRSRFDTVNDPFLPTATLNEEAGQMFHYHSQTRSSSNALSPKRYAVNRDGQMYHVQKRAAPPNDNPLGMDEDAAPVVSIPEVTVQHSTENEGDVLNYGTDNSLYQMFLIGLNQTNLPTETSKELYKGDKRYSPPKNGFESDEEENNVEEQLDPASELDSLFNDIRKNPIDGLTVGPNIVEEPLLVTRATVRSKPDIAPSLSMSPRAQLKEAYLKERQTQKTASSRLQSGVASRTRSQLSPPKRTLINSPLPQSVSVQKADCPIKTGATPRNDTLHVTFATPVCEPSISKACKKFSPSVLSPSELAAQISDHYKSYGVRLTKVLSKEELSDDYKCTLCQMFDAILNRPCFESNRANQEETLQEAEEAFCLMECFLRIVGLVSGDYTCSQIRPYFEAACRVDEGLALLAFGLLIFDESPYILQLAPLLHGKTALLKTLRIQMQKMDNPSAQTKLISIARRILLAEDGGTISDADLRLAAQKQLHVLGTEGVLLPSHYELIDEESITNVEEKMKELLIAKQEGDEAGKPRKCSVSPPPPTKNIQMDTALENSNSSLAFPATPEKEGTMHIETCSLPPIVASTPTRHTSTISPLVISSSAVRNTVPRRIGFLSAPIPYSPLKEREKLFASPSGRQKYELRSNYKLPNNPFRL